MSGSNKPRYKLAGDYVAAMSFLAAGINFAVLLLAPRVLIRGQPIGFDLFIYVLCLANIGAILPGSIRRVKVCTWIAVSGNLALVAVLCLLYGQAGLLVIPAPGFFILIILKNKRIVTPKGFCTRCQYDLTGNITGACPECGQAIESTESEPATG